MEYFQDVKFIYWKKIENYNNFHESFPAQPALHLVRRGKLLFGFGDNPVQEIEAPVVYWENPEKKCLYGNPGGSCWDHSFITFTGERAYRMLNDGLMQINQNGFVKPRNPLEFIEIYDEILGLLEFDHKINKHGQAVALLEQLIVMLAESESYMPQSPYADNIEILSREIREHPLADWDFKKLAGKRFFISYVYFRQLFRNIIGAAPADYLNWCRMRYAMELMRDSSLSIGEIAYKCKYNNQSAFARAFRRKTGISAQEYCRSLNRNKN